MWPLMDEHRMNQMVVCEDSEGVGVWGAFKGLCLLLANFPALVLLLPSPGAFCLGRLLHLFLAIRHLLTVPFGAPVLLQTCQQDVAYCCTATHHLAWETNVLEGESIHRLTLQTIKMT